MSHTSLHATTWPATRLSEALLALGRHSGLAHATVTNDTQTTPPATLKQAEWGHWLSACANSVGLETEAVTITFSEATNFVRGASPALLTLRIDDEPRFLAILGSRRNTVTVLTPDLQTTRLPIPTIREILCQPLEAPLRPEIDSLLDEVGLTGRRRLQAEQTVLRERLSGTTFQVGWLLRPQPGNHLRWHIRQAHLPRHLFVFLASYVVQYLIWLLAWWVIGRSALQGRIEPGWLITWGLLLLSIIPFKLFTNYAQGQVAIRTGGILKSRLLAGALRLTPEEIRHKGAGQFLGQVIEAEAVESLALSGGLLAVVALIELLIAALVMLAGVGGGWQVGLLAGWLGVTSWLGWRYFHRRHRWTNTRLALTDDLLERMVGHRTRLVQEKPSQWHHGEDEALDGYLTDSRQMDEATMQLTTLIPRGWLVLGLIGLLPQFAFTAADPAIIAVALGGLLLAYQALHKLTPSVQHLAGAAIAWEQVQALFTAAARPQLTGSPQFSIKPEAQGNTSPLIEAHGLAFRYRPEGKPILDNCQLQIQANDRLLLEGPSGGGKSTLGTLLTGLRQPNSGLLLLHGLDQQTLGDTAWRQRVIAAPQFHENHVLTGTFAFNLLMGRQWPPSQADLTAAETICQELGLSELLTRMPSGLMQMVGETGWQLSHGERSRLFLARALLQEADLTILDESFAALDPENMASALRCVLDRANALLVIAHP